MCKEFISCFQYYMKGRSEIVQVCLHMRGLNEAQICLETVTESQCGGICILGEHESVNLVPLF
jgi:hypothetical protein